MWTGVPNCDTCPNLKAIKRRTTRSPITYRSCRLFSQIFPSTKVYFLLVLITDRIFIKKNMSKTLALPRRWFSNSVFSANVLCLSISENIKQRLFNGYVPDHQISTDFTTSQNSLGERSSVLTKNKNWRRKRHKTEPGTSGSTQWEKICAQQIYFMNK